MNPGTLDLTAHPIPVLAFEAVTRGFLGSDREQKALGGFESWTCAACGYTELYAKNLGDVDALAAQWPDHARIVDSSKTSAGPFR
jgi:hypothetical protein